MTGSRPAAAGQHALLRPVLEESQHLDAGVRTQMERSLGATFGEVVVHVGAASGALAESYDAAAFTVGRHVVFGPGRFDTSTLRGRTLIAHELSHVVEQRRGGGDPDLGVRAPAGVIPLHSSHSEGAGRTAAQTALGRPASVTGTTGVGVARQTKVEERASLSTAPAMTQAMTRPREAAAPAAPSLQLPPGDARNASRLVMKAIEDLAPLPDGRFATTYMGQPLVMTAEDADKARAAARNSLVDVAARSRRRFEDAYGRYQAQEEVDDEFWLSSKAAHAAAWISTGGAHQDPWLALTVHRQQVVQGELNVQRLVAEGRLASAAVEASRSELASGQSAALVRVYVDETIEGAEAMATSLEYTRNAAFVTLGVLAVVVSGGAAAGLAPGVLGTGVAGMSVGTTVTVISVGAPIVANLGVGVAKLVEGDPVDWGDIAFQAAVDIVLARFGGKLGQSVFGKLAGNEVGRTVMRRVLSSMGTGVIMHEASQAFTVTVNETYAALRGRPVSWGQFVDELAKRMADPSGIFMAAAMSGFHVAADGKLGKAAAAKLGSPVGGSPKSSSSPTVKPVQEPAVPATPVLDPAVPARPVQQPAAPAKPKGAKTLSPSELMRRAAAGERLRVKAEARAQTAEAKQQAATQKASAAKTRLGKAQDAVDARNQAGRKPTKAQQDAVQRAKKAVASTEARQSRATKSTQVARSKLDSATKQAAARSSALEQAKTASLAKSKNNAKPKATAKPKKQDAAAVTTELKTLSERAAALRKRAVEDPRAVEELDALYGKASDRALAKMEKSDPVAAQVLARRRARNEEAAKIISGEIEVPRAPHEATVIVTNDDGRTVLMAAEGVPRTPGGPIPLGPARRELKSGGTSTPERRKQVGMNRANQESHTEAKAVQLPLRKGQTMTILGQYDPCASCRGYMQRKANESGGTVVYQWMGGTVTFTPGGGTP